MTEINTRVNQIKSSDNPLLRNDFIIDYKPFVLKTVSATTKRYVTAENDDTFSIGLEAFNQAIDRFEDGKGNFLGYASAIIKSKVIDYLRKESKLNSQLVNDDEYIDTVTNNVNEDLLQEINLFKEQLNLFNISLDDLVEHSPKQTKAREEVTSLGVSVANEDTIVNTMYRKRTLPIAEICLRFNQSKKRVKLFRQFIIGVVVIVKEELTMIQSYLNNGGN